MDTGINSGGRVTRASSKRLTSVDSDNGSSRAGAPTQSKLATSTANSPLKPRMTRRNSISGTPSKTPAKRAVNAVPPLIARSMRQRTASLEETRKNENKVSHLESLTEEEDSGPIMMRFKSNSPEEATFQAKTTVSQRGRKSMVQNRSRNSEQTLPKKEIDNEEVKCYEDLNNEENNIDVLKLHNVFANANIAKGNPKVLREDAKSLSNDFAAQRIESQQNRTSLGISFLKETEKLNLAEDRNVSPSIRNSLASDINAGLEKSFEIEKEDHSNDAIESEKSYTTCYTSLESIIRKFPALSAGYEPEKADVDINESPKSVSPTSPAAKSPKLHQATTPAGNVITDANRGRHSLKIVLFASNNLDDECIKNSYPKTPASVKNKSFANYKTDDTSFQAKCSVNESIVSVHDTTDVEIAETTQQEEITSTQCATKTIAEDDTVVSMAEDNTSNAGEKLEGNDRSIVEEHQADNNEKLGEKSDAESEIQLKLFSPRVMAKNCKLETIGKGEETVSVVDECAHKNKSFVNNKTDDTSFQAKCSVNESIVSVHDTTDVEIAETTQQEEITSTQCATKTIVEDDTVVSMAEDNTSHAGEKLAGNDRSIVGELQQDNNDKLGEKSDAESEIQLKLLSPRVMAKSCKLETIGKGEETVSVVDECAHNKSFVNNKIDDTSFQAKCSVNESVVSVHDTTDVEIAETTQQEEITSTQCAIKTIAEHDTVVSMAEDNTSNAGEKLEGNDRSIVGELQQDNNDKLGEKSDAESEIQLKLFSPRVMAKNCKLETIGKGEETVAIVDECAHKNKSFVSTQCAIKTIAEDDTVVSMAEDNTSNAGEKLEGNDRSIVGELQQDNNNKLVEKSDAESEIQLKLFSPRVMAKSCKLETIGKREETVAVVDECVHKNISFANTQCGTKTIAEDDTVVSMAEDNTSNAGEKLEGNDRSIVEEHQADNNEKLGEKSDAESEIQLKLFSPRVMAQNCKLETIGKGEETVSVVDECAHKNKSFANTQCAIKTIAEDDTVVSMAEDNTSNAGEKLEGNDRSIVGELQQGNNDKLGEKSDAESEIQLKLLSPSVMAKSCKLETIGKGEETVSLVDECAHMEKKKPKKTFSRAKYNDDSDNESLRDEEYDEFLDEEEEEYQGQKYKHVFIDEAMDVDDYESGDSMESEERREIIEYEISADGESIGSHTTDEEESEDAECDNDSLVVTDEEITIDSYYSDLNKNVKVPGDDENTTDSYYSDFNKNIKVPGDRKKKRDYKRIQRVLDTSSDEDEKSKENVSKRNEFSPTKGSDSEDMVRKSEIPNKSNKISKQLQCATEDETNSSGEKATHDTSKCRSSTVHNISKAGELKTNANNSHNSSRLSDTALQLQQSYIKDCEDLCSVEGDINMSKKDILRKLNHSDRFKKPVRDINPEVDVSPDAVPIINTKNYDSEVEKPTSRSSFICEADLYDRKSVNKESLLNTKQSESHLGEVSAISENKSDQEDACTGGDSGEEVENVQGQEKSEAKKARALSVSFDCFKQQQKKKALQKEALQHSFTIGVSVNDGELETEVIQNVLTTSKPVTASSSPSASLSSNEDADGGVLSSADARYLENVKQMPLGNPLVRTHRQALELPTNPDMAIGDIQHGYKKLHKRKSLAVLERNDLNPSQSFVDSVQLRKAELEQQKISKRKRLSKSYGGTTADTSVVEIDVHHLHKRSKLSLENSIAESVGNTKKDNSSHTSTPHELGSTKQLSNSATWGHILNRCDEILEAANRAKLEAKLNYRKCKIRLSKKNKKILQKIDKAVAPIRKEIRKRDKAKIAVKASGNVIMSQQRNTAPEPNRLPPIVLQSLADCQSVAKKNKKEKLKEVNFGCRNYFTAAGNVVEMLPTPKKKKKAEIIRLTTGNVYVEPLSPIRCSIICCNGLMFHESPMSPSAVGFTVCDAQSTNGNKDRKRKRIADGRKQAFYTPIWSQSGTFMEEEIPTARPPHFVSQARISKRAQRQANNNFKQSDMNREDVKRSTAREILQLRERRQFRN